MQGERTVYSECFLRLDERQRISLYELNLAILDWLSEANTVPMPTAFTSLLVLYGVENDEPILKKISNVRRHTASDHLYAQIGYAR